VTAPYDYEALWMKGKLFANLAMDESEERTFDERALWAALALELLAKAALARFSPLLIAVPNEDGVNLLIASGLVDGDARFKSVSARTLFLRCARAFKPFNSEESIRIANARNEYLHAANPSFTVIPPEAWWPRFWAQAEVLINALDLTVEDFVGERRSHDVYAYLEKNQSNLEQRLDMLIERARQRRTQEESGELRVRVARDAASSRSLHADLVHSVPEECPACGGIGVLEGEDVLNYDLRYERTSPDDFDAWVELTVGADHFGCEECRLVLDSYDLITLAGLPDEFLAEGDIDEYYEPDYGND
jgi:hypothetical protein